MARDRPLELVFPVWSAIVTNAFDREVPDDGEPNVTIYNTQLAELVRQNKNTWFTAPWLYAE